METRTFGGLWDVSALTLGGGGIGQVWGATTREEAVATTREAVEAGITLLDVAPLYGQGEAEAVIGEAFGGSLPPGVRVSTKCRLDNRPAAEVAATLEASLRESLRRMGLDRVDVFFLHSQVIQDDVENPHQSTPLSLLREAAAPAIEMMREQGWIGAWGMSAIGVPSALLQVLEDGPAPQAIQAIANCLDSPGALRRYDEPDRPRDIIEAAVRRGAAVMGIRAVQAGALTDALDRPLPDDHPEIDRFPPRRALPGHCPRDRGSARRTGAPVLPVDEGRRHRGAGRQEPAGASGVRRSGGTRIPGLGADGPHRPGSGPLALDARLSRRPLQNRRCAQTAPFSTGDASHQPGGVRRNSCPRSRGQVGIEVAG